MVRKGKPVSLLKKNQVLNLPGRLGLGLTALLLLLFQCRGRSRKIKKSESLTCKCLPHPIPTSLSGDPISPVPTVQPIAQCPWTVTGPRASDSSARRRRDKQGLSLASGHAGCGKDPTRSGGRRSGWNWRGVGRDKSFILTQVPMGGGPCPSLFLSTKNVPLVRNDALWTLTLWSNANSQGFPERDGVVTSCNEFSPLAFSS